MYVVAKTRFVLWLSKLIVTTETVMLKCSMCHMENVFDMHHSCILWLPERIWFQCPIMLYWYSQIFVNNHFFSIMKWNILFAWRCTCYEINPSIHLKSQTSVTLSTHLKTHMMLKKLVWARVSQSRLWVVGYSHSLIGLQQSSSTLYLLHMNIMYRKTLIIFSSFLMKFAFFFLLFTIY